MPTRICGAIGIEQRYPWSPRATEGELSLQVYGYGADFYVNVHYEDGGMDDAQFYGQFSDGWERLSMPVSKERNISRLELHVLVAVDSCIDDISLQGSSTALPFRPPESRRLPEDLNGRPLRVLLDRRSTG